MTAKAIQRILRRADPLLTVVQSPKDGSWRVVKPVDVTVYAHRNPGVLPSSGVYVTREVQRVPKFMFALPFGLTQRSLDHAHRMMFWKRGVSPDAVADALDRDDRMRDLSATNDRRRYSQSFKSDWGRQIAKRIKGEPTVNIPLKTT